MKHVLSSVERDPSNIFSNPTSCSQLSLPKSSGPTIWLPESVSHYLTTCFVSFHSVHRSFRSSAKGCLCIRLCSICLSSIENAVQSCVLYQLQTWQWLGLTKVYMKQRKKDLFCFWLGRNIKNCIIYFVFWMTKTYHLNHTLQAPRMKRHSFCISCRYS